MRFHVITIFPEMFDSYLKESILGRAIQAKKISIKFYNPMDFCEPKKRVDDRPYGGGPGMVLRSEPFLKALEAALRKLKVKSVKLKVINFSPSGKKFTTSYAKESAHKYTDLIFICGRYEGLDARVEKIIKNWKLKIENSPMALYGGSINSKNAGDFLKEREIRGVLVGGASVNKEEFCKILSVVSKLK